MKKFKQSLKYAIIGLRHSFKRQRNFRIMTYMSLVITILGIVLKISVMEWILITWAIFSVLISEMVNTAVEYIINLIHKRQDTYAKLAKDVAAGAVLLSTFLSIVIGFVVFIPKIIGLF